MGLLVDITHPQRVRDAAHAAELLRALGVETTIRISGLEPRTPAHIDRILEVAPRDSQITFEDGVLDEVTLDVLEVVAAKIEGYLDLNTRTASLRVWKESTWMHGYARISDADVSAILGHAVTIPDGSTTIDDVVFELPGSNGHVPFDVRTRRTDIATRLFRVLCDGKVTRGFCNVLVDELRDPLRFFLRRLQAKLTVELAVDLDTAVAITNEIPHEEAHWDVHTPDVRILFPERTVMTYILAPTAANGEAEWLAQITDAFRNLKPR